MSRNIINAIEKYKYVSFDIFDTLILRDVETPSDIFRIMEYTKMSINVEDFAEKRIAAESGAIQKSNNAEITLDDIYDCIYDYTEAERSQLKKLEIETEIKYCRRNEEFNKVLNYCKEKDKCVSIVSDMYLSRDVIEEILSESKITYDKLFISSEYMARKSRGKLYDIVLSELNISKNELIHIGDNKKSDYLIPKIKGIATFHYKKKRKKMRSKSLQQSIIDACSNNRGIDENSFYGFGYQVFGPLLYGMCQWIELKVKDGQFSKVHFYSRDGLIVKKAYEIIYGSNNIEYVYVSRRSLTVPRLIHAQCIEDVLEIVPYIKRMEETENLLHKLGIEDDILIDSIINKFGKKIERVDLVGKYHDSFFDAIKSYMWDNAAHELKSCARYLRQCYCNLDSIAVVDIGWYGTMQLSVLKLLHELKMECKIVGLYLGYIDRNSDDYRKLDAHGFIYDCCEERLFEEEFIYSFNGLIESFFTANHGSTKRYLLNNERIEVELEEVENTNSGRVTEIQQGALNFAKDYYELVNGYNIVVDAKTAFSRLEKTLLNPNKNERNMFGNMIFYDVYYNKLIDFKGYSYYLTHPATLFNDLISSDWKCGFIKTMVPLAIQPKYVYRLMKKLKSKKNQ